MFDLIVIKDFWNPYKLYIEAILLYFQPCDLPRFQILIPNNQT